MRIRGTLLFSVSIAIAFALIRLSDQPAYAAPDGKAIYEDRCAICHGSNGEGLPGSFGQVGTFPPLAGNPHVTAKDPSAVIVATLNGMLVDIIVRSRRYVGGMPGWSNWLSNADVAAVATYIRTAWGNRGSPVTEAQVARIRK
jgi:mono/diheme cytochrome c family protein